MFTGTIKWFDSVKGYGFIQPDESSRDAFVHASTVEQAGMATRDEGQKVSHILWHDPETRKNAASEPRSR